MKNIWDMILKCGIMSVRAFIEKNPACVNERSDLDMAKVVSHKPELLKSQFFKYPRCLTNLTPLHLAAFIGNADLCKILIQNGADLNAVDELKRSAIHWAVEAIDMSYLICIANWIPLVSCNHTEVVSYLTSLKNLNINQADSMGETALHYASFNNHIEVVRTLTCIDNIQIDSANSNNETALRQAALKANSDIVIHLLLKGANHLKEDDTGKTTLCALTERKSLCETDKQIIFILNNVDDFFNAAKEHKQEENVDYLFKTKKNLKELVQISEKIFSDNEVLDAFICPITLEPMVYPVIAGDGHSYEKKSIEIWFDTHNRSPLTNMQISREFTQNYTLSKAIDEFNAKRTEAQATLLSTKEILNDDALLKTRGNLKELVQKLEKTCEVLNAFKCPLTCEVMIEPVMAGDGHSYENVEIKAWFECYLVSPVTHMRIPSSMIQNHTLRKAIDELNANHFEIQARLLIANEILNDSSIDLRPFSRPVCSSNEHTNVDEKLDDVHQSPLLQERASFFANQQDNQNQINVAQNDRRIERSCPI